MSSSSSSSPSSPSPPPPMSTTTAAAAVAAHLKPPPPTSTAAAAPSPLHAAAATTTTIPITAATPKSPPTSAASSPHNHRSPPATAASSPYNHRRSPLRETLPPNPALPSPAPPPPSKPLAGVAPPPLVVHHPPLALAKVDDALPIRAAEAADRGSKVVSGIVRRSRLGAELRRAGLAARVAAAVLSMVSFSVMAADRSKGWAGDSYDRYREYRYCITVNIITFVYSSFQIYAHIHQIKKSKVIIRPPINYYFALFFDQMLAYLLISASAAASTRNYDWIVSWGSDPFTVMINASVSMSYLAFAALALCSLISAHNLFSRVV